MALFIIILLLVAILVTLLGAWQVAAVILAVVFLLVLGLSLVNEAVQVFGVGELIGIAIFVGVFVLGIAAHHRHKRLNVEKRWEEQEREQRRMGYQYPGDFTDLPPSDTDQDTPDPRT